MAGATERKAGGRAPQRTRVLMTGTLFTPSGAQRVRIRDISRDGAQIFGESPIPDQCDAIFKRGKIFAASRVAWSNHRHAGLRFYRSLSLADVNSVFNDIPRELCGG